MNYSFLSHCFGAERHKNQQARPSCARAPGLRVTWVSVARVSGFLFVGGAASLRPGRVAATADISRSCGKTLFSALICAWRAPPAARAYGHRPIPRPSPEVWGEPFTRPRRCDIRGTRSGERSGAAACGYLGGRQGEGEFAVPFAGVGGGGGEACRHAGRGRGGRSLERGWKAAMAGKLRYLRFGGRGVERPGRDSLA